MAAAGPLHERRRLSRAAAAAHVRRRQCAGAADCRHGQGEAMGVRRRRQCAWEIGAAACSSSRLYYSALPRSLSLLPQLPWPLPTALANSRAGPPCLRSPPFPRPSNVTQPLVSPLTAAHSHISTAPPYPSRSLLWELSILFANFGTTSPSFLDPPQSLSHAPKIQVQ